jgi:hypothetical protein
MDSLQDASKSQNQEGKEKKEEETAPVRIVPLQPSDERVEVSEKLRLLQRKKRSAQREKGRKRRRTIPLSWLNGSISPAGPGDGGRDSGFEVGPWRAVRTAR